MTDVQVLYGEGTAGTNTTTTPQTIASIANTSFTANKKYLILAAGHCRSTSGSGNVEMRLAHGTTPTVFDDGPMSAELTANVQESEWSFAVVYTQPGTTEQIVLQFNRNTEFTGTVTCELGQIIAINLDDIGTQSTDYWYTIDLVDYTTTASKVSKASITWTPNGTDDYWAIGYGVFSGVAINSNHLMDLNDSVAGVLSAVDVEGEDATNDKKSYLLSAPYTPSNASHTLSVRFSHESAALTVLQNAVFLINLNKFAQHAITYAAGQEQPAASPSWTTTRTISITPTTTGNFVIFGHYDNDVGTLTDDVATRLQVNNGGGLASDPAYTDSSPGADSWDATDVTCFNIFKLRSLTSGASRTINLDASMVAGTTLRVQNRSLVVFSVAKAAGGTQYTVDVAGTLTSSGLLVKQDNKVLAGVLTDSGALTKQTTHSFAGTLTSSGLLVKQAGKILAGTLTTAASLVLQAGKALAGTLTSAGSLMKQMTAAFAGMLTSSGALIKQTTRAVAGTLTSAGALSVTKVVLLSLAGTLTSAGGLVNQTNKALAGTLTSIGAIINQVGLHFVGMLTDTGTLVKQANKILAGALTSAGALTRQVAVSFTGTLTSAGGLVKQTTQSFAGTLTSVGSLIQQTRKTLSGLWNAAGALVTQLIPGGGGAQYPVAVAGTLTMAGDVTITLIPGAPPAIDSVSDVASFVYTVGDTVSFTQTLTEAATMTETVGEP